MADWPYIFRHRRYLKSLDNILALTRGAPLSWTNLLASIRPLDHVFTGICEDDQIHQSWIGQIHQSPRLTSAHIHYLLQPADGDSRDFCALLENLIVKAGGWGAKQVVADVEPDSETFVQFRRAGFSVLAKHKIFKLTLPLEGEQKLEGRWRIWNKTDIHKMRGLYFTLVPPLIQPVEPLTRREMLGLVYYDPSGELLAYADLVYGPIGAWVLPFIHPQATENMSDLLAQLLLDLPDLAGRPVYITARSYQPWIEGALKQISAKESPEQALMVRYLALRQRVRAEVTFAPIENSEPEPTIPLAPIKRHREKL